MFAVYARYVSTSAGKVSEESGYGFPVAAIQPDGAAGDPALRVLFESCELASTYEADVSPAMTAAEVVSSLVGPATNSWLGSLAPGEAYRLVLLRTGEEIADTLAAAGAKDDDRILVTRVAHGAGPGPLDVAAGLATAKLTIDAARVGIDAYRARTERLAANLEREKFESEAQSAPTPQDHLRDTGPG